MVGPLNPTGRVPVVAGVEGDPRIVWVGAASGGVWKSEDGGVTFRPVFDEQDVHSIGDIAIAPSNPDVVYVGTGEGNPRNSVSPGGGVFKTTDGGKTWSFLGLEETRHIPRIVVDSTNPDVAYVAALGHVFGPNSDRGIFKTTDGGATWQKSLFTDDRHGAADVDVYAKNPNLVFAGLWRFDRKPWTHISGDKEGGLWRSVDGGKRWTRLTKGLPALMGRLSVRVAPSDSKVVYVIAETNEGTLFRSDDGGDTFKKMSDKQDLISRGLYYTQVRVHPTNPDIVFAVGSTMWKSIDGGKAWTRLSDHHPHRLPLAVDRRDESESDVERSGRRCRGHVRRRFEVGAHSQSAPRPGVPGIRGHPGAFLQPRHGPAGQRDLVGPVAHP